MLLEECTVEAEANGVGWVSGLDGQGGLEMSSSNLISASDSTCST